VPRARQSAPRVSLLIDVVCGTQFDPTLTAFGAAHEGRPYRFCSLACQRQFEADPGAYAALADELSASRS
jgi:P-type Cu+ transporter